MERLLEAVEDAFLGDDFSDDDVCELDDTDEGEIDSVDFASESKIKAPCGDLLGD